MGSRLISVIIPTFNREKTIAASIESVQNQTCENWELIVVDDGSTDSTYEIVRNYLYDPRIKFKRQKNRGVSVARNFGAELASGDYLLFLDSDDTFYPDLIESLYKAEFYKFDLICWQVLKIINGKKQIWKARKLGGMYNNIKATFFPGSICYKKEIFWKVGGYDPKMTFGENYELGIRISDIKDIKIRLLDQIFLEYRLETLKRTSNSLENRINSHIHQYKKHILKYDKNLKAKAEMNYIIGFVLEKFDKKFAALDQYKNAWRNNPWRIKAILKIIYLKFF